jgi:hypothetical protein
VRQSSRSRSRCACVADDVGVGDHVLTWRDSLAQRATRARGATHRLARAAPRASRGSTRRRATVPRDDARRRRRRASLPPTPPYRARGRRERDDRGRHRDCARTRGGGWWGGWCRRARRAQRSTRGPRRACCSR